MDHQGGIDRIQCWPGRGQHTPGDFHASAFRCRIINIVPDPFYYWIHRSGPPNIPFEGIQKKISVIQQAAHMSGLLYN